MDHLYWREAGFYPCKICETSSSDISRLGFRDLRGGLSCMFLLNFNGDKSSTFCRVFLEYENIDHLYMLSIFQGRAHRLLVRLIESW